MDYFLLKLSVIPVLIHFLSDPLLVGRVISVKIMFVLMF